MTEPNSQPSCATPVLLPTLVDGAFDYLVPQGTPTGTLVETTLAGRKLIGAVWDAPSMMQTTRSRDGRGEPRNDLERSGKGEPASQRGLGVIPASVEKNFKLKPITRTIDSVPPLARAYRAWLDWIAEFTLAPKGAVLSLCGLAHAARVTKKKYTPETFAITLPTLTPDQQAAADALTTNDSKPTLLDGVTGSGKTEVYFHAIARALQSYDLALRSGDGRREPERSERGGSGSDGGLAPSAPKAQILVLLPEIALTHQWYERFEKTFGARPCAWHSRLTPVAKARAWQAVARGEVQVVVGARSALFLPFKNLSLIIVDEEHDPSYKQEDGVLYHARDMAIARAHFEKIPIILASATPSLETMENVREGKYRALHLTSRYGVAGLPTVRLIDMRNDPPERGDFISPMVKKEMMQTLARGEQVLFFLNRRGYAPLLLCRACGHRFECSNCSAWLVVHGRNRLECHHCGHKEPLPKACPSCAAEADKLAPCGPGVERIAEEVRHMFLPHKENSSEPCVAFYGEPERSERGGAVAGAERTHAHGVRQPILALLSSDESIPPETWAAIEAGEIDILVGTQMVAKGHHFPRLTLVVVVDADVGLDGADLRAGERSYQLLHQLGGRAGRGELLGTVLVQTYAPDHAVMKALVAHDRDRLMALEAKERRAGNWPPFGQLAAILLDGKDDMAVRAAGQMLARTAPDDARIKVLGPAPAPLSKLRGQYRYRLLVKASDGIHLQRTLKGWLGTQKFKGVRIKIDVNPYYFL